MLVPARFELAQGSGESETGQKGKREFHAIMRVELQFRQKIARCNAKECPRREG